MSPKKTRTGRFGLMLSRSMLEICLNPGAGKERPMARKLWIVLGVVLATFIASPNLGNAQGRGGFHGGGFHGGSFHGGLGVHRGFGFRGGWFWLPGRWLGLGSRMGLGSWLGLGPGLGLGLALEGGAESPLA